MGFKKSKTAVLRLFSAVNWDYSRHIDFLGFFLVTMTTSAFNVNRWQNILHVLKAGVSRDKQAVESCLDRLCQGFWQIFEEPKFIFLLEETKK